MGAAAYPASQREWRLRVSHPALVLPLLVYLAAFYAYPVAAMMFRSIAEPSWTLENFRRIFETPVILYVLWLTFRVAFVVTLAALVLGYPVAYLLARLAPAKSNLLMMLVLLPFWTSILVRTYAWMVLLGREGIVNQLLLWLGVIDEPLRLLNTTFAVSTRTSCAPRKGSARGRAASSARSCCRSPCPACRPGASSCSSCRSVS